MVLFDQALRVVRAQRVRIVGVVLVDDERVAVVAVEDSSGDKPHETPDDPGTWPRFVLAQAIVRRELSEFEVPYRNIAALSVARLQAAGGRTRFPSSSVPGGPARVSASGTRVLGNVKRRS